MEGVMVKKGLGDGEGSWARRKQARKRKVLKTQITMRG